MGRMSHRYGTRSSTKTALRGRSVAVNPLTPQEPVALIDFPMATADAQTIRSDGNGRPPSTGAVAPPSRTDNGREPLVPPLPAKRAASGHPPRPPPSAPPPGAAAISIGAENRPPSGGSIGIDRRRKRSRLSLVGKRRASPVQQQIVVGSGSPVDDLASYASQHRRRSPCLAPVALPPIDGKGDHRSNGVVGCYPGGISPRLTGSSLDETGETATSPRQPRRPASDNGNRPLPPFVGLENLGETCYVNAVLQALAACRRVLMSSREASLVGSGEGKTAGRQDGEDLAGPLPVALSEAADVADRLLVGEISAARCVRTDGNPVQHALGEVLRGMETRNRALIQQESAASSPQIVARTPSALFVQTPISSEVSEPGIAVESVSDAAAVTTEAGHTRSETPLRPGDSAKKHPRPGAFAPSALVELIHEGWLSTEHAAGEATSVRARLGREIRVPAASADFGTGQACVSEFLGKLLHLGTSDRGAGIFLGEVKRRGASSPSGVSAGDAADGACGLAGSFRGTLCSRTLCVECERDRTIREDFMELMLPPLVLPRQPPSSPGPTTALTGGAAAPAGTGGDRDCSKIFEERRTLQSLFDGVLCRESLEGSNKVWCEACHQWTEAERRSSLHSPPELLALHIRPGIGKQSSLRPCPIFPAASNGSTGRQGGAAVGRDSGRGSLSKADGGAPVGGEQREDDGNNREMINRVLVVKKGTRCQFHHQEGAVPSDGAGSASAGTRRCDSGDALYDLVGAILHQGQTLGSGHYTFVLHAENGVPAGPFRHRPPPAPENISIARGTSENSARSSSQGRDIGGNPEPAKVEQQGPPSAGGRGRVDASVAPASSTKCGKPAFLALFDDAVVRWLTPEEVRVVLRGGGAGLGEPFLVFYSRRPWHRTRDD